MTHHQPPPIMSPTWTPRTKRIVGMVLFVGAFLLLLVLRDLVVLLVFSIVLAYLLNPMVTFLDRQVLSIVMGSWLRRGIAVLLTFAFVIFLLVILTLVVLPLLVDQIEEFGSQIPEFVRTIVLELERILSEPLMFNNEPILINGEPFVPLEQLTQATGSSNIGELIQLESFDLMEILRTFLGSVGGLTEPAFNVLGGAVNTIVTLSFLLFILFYLLRDGQLFADRVVDVIPKSYRSDARRLMHELSLVWNAYLRGQLILSTSIGVAVYIAAVVLGLPNAPILALIAGIFEFIPNVGPTLALIPAAFLALLSESTTIPYLQGAPFMIIVIIVWTTLQTIEAMVLVPRVMGGSLDLHPLVVLLGLIGGASIAGALGVILAAPIIASTRVIATYLYGKLTDQNLFANQPVITADSRKPLTWIWLQRVRDFVQSLVRKAQQRLDNRRSVSDSA